MQLICGVASLSGDPVDEGAVRPVARFPGPHAVEPWVLTHRRIALAAVGAARAEHAETGAIAVLAGAVHNRRDLRAALGASAAAEPLSDAAWALAAYRRWATDGVRRLVGEFALAIWDAHERTLLLARDPLGVRPLFYAEHDGKLVFASTLEQVLAYPGMPDEVDDDAVVAHLYGPLLPPPRRGAFHRGIGALPGGRVLLASRGRWRIGRYHEWQEEPPRDLASGTEPEEFRAVFTDAVRARISTGSPVGILLSGGLDSGSIASVAGRLRGSGEQAELRTYSHVFDRFVASDERVYSRAVAERYGLHNRQLVMDDHWTLSALERWLPAFVDPSMGAQDAMFFQSLEAARADGVRTVLTGDVGDILFRGSLRHLAGWLVHGRLRRLHRELRSLPPPRWDRYAYRFAAWSVLPLAPPRLQRTVERRRVGLHELVPWMPEHVRRRFADDPGPRLFSGPHAWWYELRDGVERLMFGGHNVHLERLGRMFGLEVSQPFQDARLVDLALRLPAEAVYRRGLGRRVVVDGLADVLPPLVRDRTDKAEVGRLVDYGLRERRRAFVEALTVDSELERRGYVVAGAWREAMLAYLDGRTDFLAWRSVVLELWLRHREGRLPPLR